MDCLFCKIINGEIPSNKQYEDDFCLAFCDINPQAPTHIVIIPKNHVSSVQDITSENSDVIAHIFSVIPIIAKATGVDKTGYRIITNCGKDAGQTVEHLHFHLLGGTDLGDLR